MRNLSVRPGDLVEVRPPSVGSTRDLISADVELTLHVTKGSASVPPSMGTWDATWDSTSSRIATLEAHEAIQPGEVMVAVGQSVKWGSGAKRTINAPAGWSMLQFVDGDSWGSNTWRAWLWAKVATPSDLDGPLGFTVTADGSVGGSIQTSGLTVIRVPSGSVIGSQVVSERTGYSTEVSPDDEGYGNDLILALCSAVCGGHILGNYLDGSGPEFVSMSPEDIFSSWQNGAFLLHGTELSQSSVLQYVTKEKDGEVQVGYTWRDVFFVRLR